jgi:hypothetical protein
MTRPPSTEDRERALDALAIARREGIPLGAAARRVRLRPEVVQRHVGAGFELRRGRWFAKPFDRIPREMSFLSPEGPQAVLTRDSRLASRISKHNNAVRHYLHTGDTSWLRPFRGHGMRVRDGSLVVFATDPGDLDRLADGAELVYDVYLRF